MVMQLQTLNRTIVELKSQSSELCKLRETDSQSYHSGIEMILHRVSLAIIFPSQSYHSGIEIA